MIELIIVATLLAFFLHGVVTMIQGGLLAGFGSACLAGPSLFFGCCLLRDKIHRCFNINKTPT
jgi:hypothetical protein